MSAPRVLECADKRSCRVFVRAQPGAKRSGIVGLWNEHLKVAVRAPADKGRANEEVLEVLAQALDLRPAQLSIARGASARLKEVIVPAPAAKVSERLLALLA